MAGEHLIISPHLDDAVQSCGAKVYSLTRVGSSVCVATLFTGAPPPSQLPPAAKWFHSICGLGDDAMQVRRAEDSEAARRLNADTLHLELYESLYRRDASGEARYKQVRDIFSGEVEREADTLDEVRRTLANTFDFEKYSSIYLPLGIGRHIDHLLTRAAVESISAAAESGIAQKLVYYEDLPYACRYRPKDWQAELASGLRPVLHFIDDEAWGAKLSAVFAYQSQLDVLWSDGTEMRQEFEHYASHVGNRRRAERFWTRYDSAPDA